eukprot:1464077-Rhodomonas_salina.5
MEGTQRNVAAQIADAAAQDPGFKGWVNEAGKSTSYAITIHFNFGQADQLDGVGRDTNGDFSVTGNYTEQEVFFVCRYTARFMAPRKFTGSRSKDMSISGKWLVEEGYSQSGHFSSKLPSQVCESQLVSVAASTDVLLVCSKLREQ